MTGHKRALAGSSLPDKKSKTNAKDNQRNYRPQWQAGRLWLAGRANQECSKQIMAFCVACSKFLHNKESGIKAHEETEKHIGSTKVWSKQPVVKAFMSSTVNAVQRVSE
jgi:hypothetical protein